MPNRIAGFFCRRCQTRTSSLTFTGKRDIQTTPVAFASVAPLWCDLGRGMLFPISRGIKIAANLCL